VNVLIIDTETTGLKPDKGAELIEIGAILYNVEHRAILAQISTVLPVEVVGQEDVHGISWTTARSLPLNLQSQACNLISEYGDYADYNVAHNAAFDKSFTDYFLTKHLRKDWLCTYEDFDFAPHKKQNLVTLALAHGIAVKSAHRALNDCSLIAEIFSKRSDLEQLIEAAIIRAKSPKVWVRALVEYADKDKAKAERFEWRKESRDWRKLMKACDLETLDFKWEVIEG